MNIDIHFITDIQIDQPKALRSGNTSVRHMTIKSPDGNVTITLFGNDSKALQINTDTYDAIYEADAKLTEEFKQAADRG